MADEASVEGTCSNQLMGESLEPTIEINIKTLDSQMHTFRVNKDLPVSALKEMIATSTGLPVEQQRLIFRGRVLQDDHLLSAYHIEDGHTLHLVARQPVQPGISAEDAARNNGNDSTGTPHRTGQVSHSVLLGSLNIAETGEAMAADISRLVGAVLNNLGAGNLASTGGVGNSSSTNSNQSRPSTETEATQNVSGRNQPPNFTVISNPFQPPHVSQIPRLTAIPDSLTTLSEFVNRMELVLQYDGSQFRSTNIRDPRQSEVPSLNLRGMPTLTDLRALLVQVQQLLTGNTASALSHIAGRLESEGTSADPVVRGQIQSEAMHVGVAMQHLGAMFLELGRTIMTLRMGQSPADALVNAGPAVYISPTGPNPIMVQPSPLQTSSLFGIPSPSVLSGLSGPIGVGDPSRNVSIQIHAGTSLAPGVSSSGSRVNLGEVLRAERSNAQHTSTNGNGSGDSGPTRGLSSRTIVAPIPPRSASENTRHVLSVIYPVQVRSQQSHQSVPIHSSPVQASQPSVNDGTQPNTINPVSEPSSESDASTIVAQINAQIVNALSGISQGRTSPSHGGTQPNTSNPAPESSSESDVSTLVAQINARIANALSGNPQGPSSSTPSTSLVAQPNVTSTFPHTTEETGTISSLVTHLSSQLVDALSGNAQTLSSTPSVQHADTSPTISSLVTHLSSQLVDALSGNAQTLSSTPSVQHSDTSPSTEGSQAVASASAPSVVKNDTNQRDVSLAGGEASDHSSDRSLVHDTGMPDSTRQQFQPLPECPVPSENALPLEIIYMESSATRSVDDPATCQASNSVSSEQGSQFSGKATDSDTTISSQSTKGCESDRPAPLGLGLGGLQPKRRGKPAKPIGKDAVSQNVPSASHHQQSIARGQQVLRSLASQNSDRNRESANGSAIPLPSVMSQNSNLMPLGDQGGSGQIDSSMVSQALQSPYLSNLLTGVAEQVGLGSPATLRSMLEQCTQSPGVMNTLNETMQRVGQSDDIAGLLSGIGRGNSGIDFSRMIQQMMPVVSQVLGGGPTSSAPFPGLRSESHDGSTGGTTMLGGSNSQIDVQQAVERIEQHDSPGNIFRTMLESAGRLLGEGNSFEDLVEDLGNNAELTDEFVEMFQNGISQRLQSESVPEDKS